MSILYPKTYQEFYHHIKFQNSIMNSFPQESCSYKFCNIHRKIPVLESLFIIKRTNEQIHEQITQEVKKTFSQK